MPGPTRRQQRGRRGRTARSVHAVPRPRVPVDEGSPDVRLSAHRRARPHRRPPPAALVTTDGTIDWLCTPRFDSPSIFGRLLDHERGGHFSISPTAAEVTRKQLYIPDTTILMTRFLTEAGVGEIVDFMPITNPTEASQEHRIVRMVQCVRGSMTFTVDLAPRFDYGRAPHTVEPTDDGAVFTSASTRVTVHLVREADDERLADAAITDAGDVRAEMTLTAGQTRGVVLAAGGTERPRRLSLREAWQVFDATATYWRPASRPCRTPNPRHLQTGSAGPGERSPTARSPTSTHWHAPANSTEPG